MILTCKVNHQWEAQHVDNPINHPFRYTHGLSARRQPNQPFLQMSATQSTIPSDVGNPINHPFRYTHDLSARRQPNQPSLQIYPRLSARRQSNQPSLQIYPRPLSTSATQSTIPSDIPTASQHVDNPINHPFRYTHGLSARRQPNQPSLQIYPRPPSTSAIQSTIPSDIPTASQRVDNPISHPFRYTHGSQHVGNQINHPFRYTHGSQHVGNPINHPFRYTHGLPARRQSNQPSLQIYPRPLSTSATQSTIPSDIPTTSQHVGNPINHPFRYTHGLPARRQPNQPSLQIYPRPLSTSATQSAIPSDIPTTSQHVGNPINHPFRYTHGLPARRQPNQPSLQIYPRPLSTSTTQSTIPSDVDNPINHPFRYTHGLPARRQSSQPSLQIYPRPPSTSETQSTIPSDVDNPVNHPFRYTHDLSARRQPNQPFLQMSAIQSTIPSDIPTASQHDQRETANVYSTKKQ